MADGTVDNLNLQISADSEKAMKSLDSLVDTIGRLKESLKGLRTNNIISISQGADKVAEALKDIENNIGRVSKKKTKITVDTDEIDSAIEKLRKQFSGAGMDFKFSGNTTDFEKAIKKANAELDRLFEKENKLRDIGVNVDTAGFKGLEYDISRSLNKLDILQNGLDNLRKTLDKPFKIHGTNDDLSLQESDINQNDGRTVEIEDTGYNTEAIQYIEEYAKKLDNLKTKMNITRLSAEDFEAALENLKPPEISGTNLKKLESELERLEQKILDLTNKQENMSKLGTNMDSDGMRKLSQRIVEGSLRADALKDRIEEIKKESAETERPWRKLSSLINNASTGVGKVGKQLSSASPALKKIKNMFSGKKKSDFGMGQMLGTSILFSYVFQALSAIQNAIKEGSDSLTQYSAKYNQSISGITSSLLYLRNAWTAAFSPIINAVAPYVQSFVDMIATAINAVGQFMAALTGKGYVVSAKKIWKDYAASLDDTGNSAGNAADGLGEATKAAEDLKNATLGIDELNIISPNELSSAGGSGGSASSGSGAGGTEISPGDMFETIQVSDSMKNLADMFKEAVASSDFTEIGHLISDKISTSLESIDWNSVYQKARNFGKGLATFLNGLITPRLFGNLGKTIANSINTALQGANAFAINFDWKNLGRSISTGIDKFFENWDAGLTAQTFSNFVSGILEAMTSAIETLGNEDTFADIGQRIVDFICGIKWTDLAWNMTNFFIALSKAMVELPSDLAHGILQEIVDRIFGEGNVKVPEFKIPISIPPIDLGPVTSAIDIIELLTSDTARSIGERFVEAWNISTTAWEDGEGFFSSVWKGISHILEPVDNFLESKFGEPYETIKNKWKLASMFFGTTWEDIQKVLSPVPEKFREWFQNARNNVENIWKSIGQWFGGKWGEIKNALAPVPETFRGWFQNARNNVNNIWQSIGNWFSGKWSEVKNVFSPVGETFRGWFQSARNNVNNIWNSIGSWFRDRWNDIKNVFSSVSSFFSDAFTNAANAVKNAFNGIGRKFEDIADQILNPIRNAVNSIIDGVNWVIDSLGVGSKLSHWGYARGSNGIPRDTFGVVNDQKGATYRELIVPPNGKPFIPKGRNVMLPLPKGTKILPANETKKFMKNMPHFKFGIGDLFGGAWESIKNFTGNIWDYVSNPKKIAQMAIDNFMDLSGMVQPWLRIAGGIANKLLGSIVDFVSNLFDQAVPQINYDPSAGAEQWRPLAKKALQMTGQYTEANLDRLIMQMSTESGGNPNAINNWDINAKNGTPSKGLMQVIDPTFNAYKYPGYDDIWDPLSNILAAIRYTVSRYGSLAKGWQGHGYAEGIGTITISDFFKRIPKLAGGGTVSPGQLFIANERGPELIGRYGNRSTVVNNNQVVDSVSIGVEKAFERQNIEIVYLLNQILETNQRILAKNQTITMNGKRVGREIDRSRRNAGYQFSPT